ncbi:hypothetical protein AB4Z46_04205 [Variovorax sp. M-6]|uniref:hypothetical protein n=1 Tax=Variovorax sp. M-6 TaxID=3233041 RepID=UPI003F9D9B3D
MKIVFATALVDFTVKQRLRKPRLIRDQLFVTNNPAHLAAFLTTDYIVSIGSLEARPLTNGDTVLYRIAELPDASVIPVEVINFLREAQAFLTATWLREDNSANCELAFSFVQGTMSHVHSNSLAVQYTHHSGEHKSMTVDEDGLGEICDHHASYLRGIKQQDLPAHTTFRKTVNRIDRSTRFLQQARSSEDLGQKIANYCSFFEALLSTSASELSHQLSERIAFLLAEMPTERLRIFREVKKAYGVRSKIVHGDVLSQNLITGLVDISRTCDELARSLILKILHDGELKILFIDGTNESLDAHLLNLIFGLAPSRVQAS